MSDHPEVCVGAVVVHDGALLLVRRGRGAAVGLWSIPGGRVELGEPLARAVERELLEETGLRGTCGPLLGIAERIVPEHHYVIHDHLVTVDVRGPLRAGDDALEVAWVGFDEVVRRGDVVPGLVGFLREHGVLRQG